MSADVAEVTICVPVFNGAPFVRETLEHIQAQTFTRFRCVVSVDLSTDDSLAVCRSFENDSRFKVLQQTTRQGWVGNVNTLIAGVETPYFCIAPHDDLLDPQYVARMYDELQRDRDACCAFSDIQTFAAKDGMISQPSVVGTQQHRVLDIIVNHYSSVVFRGLVRRRNPNDFPLLPVGLPHDFAADTVWMMRLALRGNLRRVPEMLYRKRYDAKSVHAGWSRFSREEQVRLHSNLYIAAARLAFEENSNATHRAEILAATRLRVQGYTQSDGWGIPSTRAEVEMALEQFDAAFPEFGERQQKRAVRSTREVILREAPYHHVAFPPPMRRRIANRIRRMMRRLFH